MTLRAIIWCAVSTKGQAADDKDSLPTQEAAARAVCEKNGWKVVETLRVAHSRRYIDIHECAADMRAEGIDAFDKLMRHWDDADFDILIVRDGDRFARTQSLHAYIVERTISIDAQIYSLADGMIGEHNFRMWIAMGGYRAAGEIDSLMKKRQIGFDARAKRGLPVNSKVVASHKLVRDEKSGKALKIVLDESRFQEWQDLATLIFEGVAWKNMEQEMFNRFGHCSPFNEPYQPHHYYRIVSTPSFWGHNARNFKQTGRGAWVREEGHPVPDGVLIVYNIFEPTYKGELADKIKAELTRREELKGKAKPQNTRRFTRLLMCAKCGYVMVYTTGKGYIALHCQSRFEQSPTRPDCNARKHISEKKVTDYIDQRLRIMAQAGDANAFFDTPAAEIDTRQIEQLGKQILEVEKQIQRMILRQASTDDTELYGQYDQTIAAASTRLGKLKERLKTLQRTHTGVDSQAKQQRAAEEIIAMGVDAFWELEDREINQLLSRLMGRRRFVVQDGNIVSAADAPVRRKRSIP